MTNADISIWLVGALRKTLLTKNLSKERSVQHLKQFLGTKFAKVNLPKLNQQSRRELLEALIHYYEIHLHGFSRPKSLPILHQIFA